MHIYIYVYVHACRSLNTCVCVYMCISLVWFGFFVQWHIKLHGLFNAKAILGDTV